MPIEPPTEGEGIPIDDSTSMAVVDAVAAVADVEPIALPPLAEHVDTDALDALMRADDFTGAIDFTYFEYRVSVTSDGGVSVTASDG